MTALHITIEMGGGGSAIFQLTPLPERERERFHSVSLVRLDQVTQSYTARVVCWKAI